MRNLHFFCLAAALFLVLPWAQAEASWSPTISNVQATPLSATDERVSWSTDQNATTVVHYGPTNSYGTTIWVNGFSTSHAVSIGGLTGGASYHYNVTSSNHQGNSTISPDQIFVAGTVVVPPPPPPPPPAAPTISSVQVLSIDQATEQVSWTTDQQASSAVAYGPTPAYGGNGNDAALLTAHAMILSGLLPGTSYHYAVTSADSGGVTTSADATFMTATGSSSGDPTAGILPSYNDTSANWRNAGLAKLGGIPNRTIVCATVNPRGGGLDDLADIQNAINACPAGQVVQLSAGTFTYTDNEYVWLNKGITVRGTGSCTGASSPYCSTLINITPGAVALYSGGIHCGTDATHLVACGGSPGIYVSPTPLYDWGWSGCDHDTACGNGTPLAADVAQGATVVQVSSTSPYSVGIWVLIDEDAAQGSVADPNPGMINPMVASSDWLSGSGSPATGRPASYDNGEWCNYGVNCNRITSELHLIAAVGTGPCPGTNCTLTFDDPVTVAFRQSGGHAAKVYYPSHQQGAPVPFLQQASVENLSIKGSPAGNINIQFCAYCWVKNVESYGWFSGAVNLVNAARAEINTTYLHDCYDCENNGTEYPIAFDAGSTENLLTNSIIRLAGKGMVARAAPSNVVSYNYVDDTFYEYSVIGDYWVDEGVTGTHFVGSHHFLFEGNWGDNCDNDDTHGNSEYHVYFRNWCTALRSPFIDPSNGYAVNDATGRGFANGVAGNTPPAPLRAAGAQSWNYWYAFVGNVLGTPGVSTANNGWVYSNGGDHEMWQLGFDSPSGQYDPHLSGASPWLFRHGNYDTVNAAVLWDSGTADHALTNSFYLTSKPAFFTGNYSWPWVTPTGSPPIQSGPVGCGGTCSGLPAKARYDAGTPFVQP